MSTHRRALWGAIGLFLAQPLLMQGDGKVYAAINTATNSVATGSNSNIATAKGWMVKNIEGDIQIPTPGVRGQACASCQSSCACRTVSGEVHAHTGRQVDHTHKMSSTMRKVAASAPAPMRNRSPVSNTSSIADSAARSLSSRRRSHQERTAPDRLLKPFPPRVKASTPSVPVPYKTASRKSRCAVALRFVQPTALLSGWPASARW